MYNLKHLSGKQNVDENAPDGEDWIYPTCNIVLEKTKIRFPFKSIPIPQTYFVSIVVFICHHCFLTRTEKRMHGIKASEHVIVNIQK